MCLIYVCIYVYDLMTAVFACVGPLCLGSCVSRVAGSYFHRMRVRASKVNTRLTCTCFIYDPFLGVYQGYWDFVGWLIRAASE